MRASCATRRRKSSAAAAAAAAAGRGGVGCEGGRHASWSFSRVVCHLKLAPAVGAADRHVLGHAHGPPDERDAQDLHLGHVPGGTGSQASGGENGRATRSVEGGGRGLRGPALFASPLPPLLT